MLQPSGGDGSIEAWRQHSRILAEQPRNRAPQYGSLVHCIDSFQRKMLAFRGLVRFVNRLRVAFSMIVVQHQVSQAECNRNQGKYTVYRAPSRLHASCEPCLHPESLRRFPIPGRCVIFAIDSDFQFLNHSIEVANDYGIALTQRMHQSIILDANHRIALVLFD